MRSPSSPTGKQALYRLLAFGGLAAALLTCLGLAAVLGVGYYLVQQELTTAVRSVTATPTASAQVLNRAPYFAADYNGTSNT